MRDEIIPSLLRFSSNATNSGNNVNWIIKNTQTTTTIHGEKERIEHQMALNRKRPNTD